MKVEGQWVFGWATGPYQRSARVNRQMQGRAAWLSTFTPFVIGGFIGSSMFMDIWGRVGTYATNLQSAFPLVFSLAFSVPFFDVHTFWLVLLFISVLFISGLLIRSKIRLNDPSETLFALTYELTKTGDPAGYLASPAGFIACVHHRIDIWDSGVSRCRCYRVALANWQIRNSNP